MKSERKAKFLVKITLTLVLLVAATLTGCSQDEMDAAAANNPELAQALAAQQAQDPQSPLAQATNVDMTQENPLGVPSSSEQVNHSRHYIELPGTRDLLVIETQRRADEVISNLYHMDRRTFLDHVSNIEPTPLEYAGHIFELTIPKGSVVTMPGTNMIISADGVNFDGEGLQISGPTAPVAVSNSSQLEPNSTAADDTVAVDQTLVAQYPSSDIIDGVEPPTNDSDEKNVRKPSRSDTCLLCGRMVFMCECKQCFCCGQHKDYCICPYSKFWW